MDLIYKISKRTNPSKAAIRHIDIGNGRPACSFYSTTFTWEQEKGTLRDVTCKRCISLYKNDDGQTPHRTNKTKIECNP